MIFEQDLSPKRTFIAGLYRLLEEYPDDLSSQILVLANATFHREMVREFSEKVFKESFMNCAKLYADAEKKDSVSKILNEDAIILKEIESSDLSSLKGTTIRRAGKLLKVFNRLRAFRPKRLTAIKLDSIFQKFDEKFNFLLPSLKKECFWSGKIEGILVLAFYNKFPFARYHFLLFPELEQKHPQILEERFHRWIFSFLHRAKIGDLAVGYNAAGAYASVGHFHFQVTLERDGFPVMQSCWKINGGNRDYPAYCRAFDSADDSWRWIMSLHREDIAYNLLYTSEAVYCFAGKKQGHYEKDPSMPDSAYTEMSGRFLFTHREDFENADFWKIKKELEKLTLKR